MAGYVFRLAFLALVVFPSLVTSQVTRASYGDSCNSTHRCSKREWLTCNKGICICVKPDVMIYETQQELDSPPESTPQATSSAKCTVKVGERCKFNLGSDESGNSLFEAFPCTENSSCDSDGFCTCDQGFYENWNGTCTKFREHAQPCNVELKCKSEFQCNGGQCSCEVNNEVYDAEVDKCVGLAGLSCKEGLCTANATCTNGFCECQGDFFQNERSTCSLKLGYDEYCTRDNQCGRETVSNLTLLCIEGQCKCDNSISIYSKAYMHSRDYGSDTRFSGWYDKQYELCAPKPGNPCANSLCVLNSFCLHERKYSPYGGTIYTGGTCTCMPGLQVCRITGLCGKGLGGSCIASSDACIDGLTCKHPGTCQCRYPKQRYDSTKKRCISEINGPCEEDSECEHQSACIKIRDSDRGRCQCKEGFIYDGKNNGCKATFNSPCSYVDKECDSLAGLTCVSRRCSCNDFSVYSETLQKCVGLVGAPCNVNVTVGACVSGASCTYPRKFIDSTRQDFTGYCTCEDGYMETEDFLCILSDEAVTTKSGEARDDWTTGTFEKLPTPVPETM